MDLVQSQPGTPRLLLTLTGVGGFVAIYVWATWKNAYELGTSPTPLAHTSRLKWLTVASLITLSFVLALLGRVSSSWLDTFIFTGAYISGSLPPRKAFPAVIVTVLASLAAGGLIGLSAFEAVQSSIILMVTWVTTISLVRTFVAGRALTTAREEIAQLAVMNERLRIARDLHDLLGHSLSLIALKSELARRLIDVSPERAALEIGDVEQVARTTLQEVREAVGRYRQPTLSGELRGAQEILAAAGIIYEYQSEPAVIEQLPSAIEADLGWAVREGVTNVIRHSRARHCWVRIKRDSQLVMVEIIDDGRPAASELAASEQNSVIPTRQSAIGHGLRGLEERITALGGRFEVGTAHNGGFRLAVSVPLSSLSMRSLPTQ